MKLGERDHNGSNQLLDINISDFNMLHMFSILHYTTLMRRSTFWGKRGLITFWIYPSYTHFPSLI